MAGPASEAGAIGSMTGLAATGDRVAFEGLVAACHGDMTRVAYVVADGNQALADDAVRAAWSIAWRDLRSVRHPELARAWLLELAANEACEMSRRARHGQVVEIPVAVRPAVRGPAAGDGALDLDRSLRRCRPSDRIPLALHVVGGLDFTEIGAVAGTSADKVHRRFLRLIARFRTELADREAVGLGAAAFEARVEAAVRGFADRAWIRVDPTETARIAATTWRAVRRHGARRFSSERARPLLLAALLVALVGGAVIVDSRPVRHPRPLVPSGVVIAAPAGWRSAGLVGDAGSDVAWLSAPGFLTRVDPSTGASRTWTTADDAAFRATRIAAARGGAVWLIDAAGRRVSLFDGATFLDVIDMPADVAVSDVAEGQDGSLWAASDVGVYRWDGRRWTFVGGDRPTLEADLIAVDATGGVWVFDFAYPGPSGHGVSRFDGDRWTTYTGRDSPPLRARVTAIEPAADGAVWIATETGVARFAKGSWTAFESLGTTAGPSILGIAKPVSMAIGPDGVVWVIEDGAARAAHYDGRTWTADDFAVMSTTQATLASTRHGVVAKTDLGLYRVVGGAWRQVTEPPAFATPSDVLSLAAVSRDELWLSVAPPDGVTGALWHWRDGSWSRAPAIGQPSDPLWIPPMGFRVAPDGRLWAATNMGVAVLHGDEWTMLDDRGATALAFGPDGTVYVGGYSDPLDPWSPSDFRALRFDGHAWTERDLPDSPLPQLGSLAVDGDGAVWATGLEAYGWGSGSPSATGCVARFRGGSWQIVGPRCDVSTQAGAVLVAPGGAIWVSIHGDESSGGAARYDGHAWTVYGKAEGLPGLAGGPDLAIAADGTVWASTQAGIARFDGTGWRLTVPGSGSGPISAAPDGAVWFVGPAGIERMADSTATRP